MVFITKSYPTWIWNSSIGGTLNDSVNAITADVSGNFYAAGQVMGDSIEISGSYYSTNNYSAAYIEKHSVKGQSIWAKLLIGDGDVVATSMCADNSGYLYVTGYYSGKHLYIADTVLVNQGISNIFIVKYDANGNLQWAKTFGGDGLDIANSIKITGDTTIYIGGKFSSTKISFDTDTLTNNGSFDAFILQCNENGNINWAQAYGSSGNEEITSLTIGLSLLVYFTGNFTSSSFKIGNKTLTNNGGSDIFLSKLNHSGAVLFANSYGGTGNDMANVVYALNSASKIFLGGEFNSNQITFGSNTLTNKGGTDGFISVCNVGGIVSAAKAIGSTGNEKISSAYIYNENVLDIGGSFDDASLDIDTITIASNGLKDGFFLTLDSTLTATKLKSIGGSSDDEITNLIAKNSDDLLFIVGNYQSSDFIIENNLLQNKGETDIFLTIYSDSANIIGSGGTKNITNLINTKDGGLYGGVILDLTYLSGNTRLFSGMTTPASLFYSDDTAKTWIQAFSTDSLEFNQKTQGWGGSCARIFTNEMGWVIAKTADLGKKYSAAVISYNNGDANTWSTFVDPIKLTHLGYQSKPISAVAISNNYIYAAAGFYLMRGNASGLDANSIIDVQNYISGLLANSTITSIAVPNSSSGYPIYFAIDTYGSPYGINRRLFKYDGSLFTEISLTSLSNINGIQNVFTHPGQISADTLFITAKDINTKAYKIYRSYNAGSTWTDISYPNALGYLFEADYNTNWVSQLPSSNGLILIIPGNALSKDLGNTWEPIIQPCYANAVHPNTTSFVVSGRNKVSYSSTGPSGIYTLPDNTLLQALTINKIARTSDKKIFYVATIAGIGYTTAYLDTNISGGKKWSPPYGQYPIVSDTTTFGSVAIDPNDSLHVVAGCAYGFYVTKTGTNGFGSLITPSGFGSNDPQVNDIAIVNKDIVIAITGGNDSSKYSGMGNIWRSVNGGLNWIKASISKFSSGNTIAVAYGATDTVLYIGTGLLSVDTGIIWKSTDLGANWTFVNYGPNSMSGNGVSRLSINDIDIMPGSTDSLYIAAGDDNSYAFVLSSDGGASYSYINLQGASAFTSVAINRTNPDSIYVAIDRDVYIYVASTNSSYLVYEGLPGERVPDLMHGSIIVGTTTGFYTFHDAYTDITTIPDKKKINDTNTIIVYPNPINNNANLKFLLTEKTTISVCVYDIMGQKVMQQNYGSFESGICEIPINTSYLHSGNYFINLQMNNAILHKKVLVVK